MNSGYDIAVGADVPLIQKPSESWDFWALSGGQWVYLGRGPEQDVDLTGFDAARRIQLLGQPYFARPTGLTQPTDGGYRMDKDGRPVK